MAAAAAVAAVVATQTTTAMRAAKAAKAARGRSGGRHCAGTVTAHHLKSVRDYSWPNRVAADVADGVTGWWGGGRTCVWRGQTRSSVIRHREFMLVRTAARMAVRTLVNHFCCE